MTTHIDEARPTSLAHVTALQACELAADALPSGGDREISPLEAGETVPAVEGTGRDPHAGCGSSDSPLPGLPSPSVSHREEVRRG